MRLTGLIRDNHPVIIKNWNDFARTLDPGGQMSEASLRDHASEILDAIVLDMETPQSDQKQTQKSKGRAGPNMMDPIGRLHANLRIESGFRIDQVLAEYRALRASVLRLCERELFAGPELLHEVTRFNEAVDSATAEAARRCTEAVGRFRDQSLAILGHELRTPLSAITLFAQLITRSKDVDDRLSRYAARILVSAGRMDRIVGELVDLSRTKLGSGLRFTTGPVDLAPLCRQVVADLEGIYPERFLRFDAFGDVRGEWDADRLVQLTSNLAGNALQHGDRKPISVIVRDDGDDVLLEVHNEGPVIPPETMERLFEPYVRAAANFTHTGAISRGLGLYLADQIVAAHGGSIEVTSTMDAGTTFLVRLPRHPPPPRHDHHVHPRAAREGGDARPSMH